MWQEVICKILSARQPSPSFAIPSNVRFHSIHITAYAAASLDNPEPKDMFPTI